MENIKATGLSVIIRSKEEFDRLKDFLGDNVLYLGFNPIYLIKSTAIVIHYSEESFLSVGSLGCAKTQEEYGCRLVEFSEYFKI